MSLSILRRSLFPTLARTELRALSTSTPLFKDADSSAKEAAAAAVDATELGRVSVKRPIGRPRTVGVKPKKKALAEDDHPPKRPLSGYTLFFKEYFLANKGSLLGPDGKYNVTEIARRVGQEWSELPVTNPQKLEALNAKAKELSQAYDREYKEWFFSRTIQERNAIEKAIGRKIHFPGGKNDFKKELRDRPGNPGRPASSFFEFSRSVQDELKQLPEMAGKTGMELHQSMARLAAERWRALSDADKEHWKKVYSERKAKFDEWFKTQKESGPQK